MVLDEALVHSVQPVEVVPSTSERTTASRSTSLLSLSKSPVTRDPYKYRLTREWFRLRRMSSVRRFSRSLISVSVAIRTSEV
jgi:hypothetical protein